MASRELNILVAAKGALKAARDIGSVDRATSNLGRSAGRLGRAAALGIGAGVAIGAAVIGRGVKSGLENLALLENATSQVQGAIDQMGLAGKLQAAQVASWANSIEADIGAAFDDKDITSATATLIRFGKVAPANLKPAMVVMTDLAAKTGSVESAAALLAKALVDPAKAAGKLAKSGVVLTAAQQLQIKTMVKAGKTTEAQTFLLTELAKVTKGAAEASVGPYQRSLNVLKDVTEDAQKALAEGFLPVIEKVRDILSRQLAKPGTLAAIKDFGKGLAGGLEKLIDVAMGLPWDSIKSAFQVMGTGAKAVLDVFMGMPAWVQTAVLTGWGLNKLTGGALGSVVGELGKGLIKGILGMTAGVVNINAGVVNGAGGLPPVASGGGGLLAAAGGVAGIGAIMAAALPFLLLLIPQIANPGFKKGVDPRITGSKGQGWETTPGDPRKGQMQGGRFNGKPLAVTLVGGMMSLEQLISRQSRKDIRDRAMAAGRGGANGPTENQITATAMRNQERLLAAQKAATESGTNRIVAAIHGIPGVSVRTVAATTNRWTRVSNHAPGTGPLAE